jgi:hypothetical membrane protein
MPRRLAPLCGLAALATFVVGVVLADRAQPGAFSPANDDISDLGAHTASSPWLYNQVAANLTGVLVLVFAFGLWRALGEGWLSRLGVAGLGIVGIGLLLDGVFRLDCQGIDAACDNTSWHSDAHRVESGVTAAALLLAPPILAFAFRRVPAWHPVWLVTLLATPASILASALFSALGDGAATRAGSVVWFGWLAFVALRLLRVADEERHRTAPGYS